MAKTSVLRMSLTSEPVNFINSRPPAEVGDADRGCEYRTPELPPTLTQIIVGPCCREPIDSNRLFSRSAFEPMDKADQSNADSDVEMDLDENDASRKNKGKVKEGYKQAVDGRNWVEDDENGDDDMSDFIVQSDEDEEAKDARRSMKKHLGKRRVNVVFDSDDEVDTPEEKEVLFGMPEKEGISAEILKRMPRFLPSSKMKAGVLNYTSVSSD